MTPQDIFRSYVRRVSRGRAGGLSHEARALFHWKILVAGFCVGVLGVSVVSFFMYRDISRGEFVPTQEKSAGGPRPQKSGLLGETIRYFETKKATFEQMRKSGTFFADPSL